MNDDDHYIDEEELDEEGEKQDGRHWRIPEWFPGLGDAAHQKLLKFHYELIHFNGRMNLISPRSERHADLTHFADCILGSSMILKACGPGEIYDLGSGNGLPGIIMAVLDPNRKIIMIDKDARKIEFIRHVAARLELKNTESRQARLEEMPEGSVNIAVSRGFANLSKAMVAVRKAAGASCQYYHFKGPSWSTEIAQIPSQICSFWEPSLLGNYKLPGMPTDMAIVLTSKTD